MLENILVLFSLSLECEYTVTTYTGDKWGAGTDANVLVIVYGKKGDTGERQMDNDGKNCENSWYVI